MNIVLLMTTTVNIFDNVSWLSQKNKQERLKMYGKKIIKWLNKSNLKIVVIENSDYKFNDLIKHTNHRFEILSFKYNKEQKEIMDKYEAKGQHEIFALEYACNYSKLIKECDYVIKITGRYFVPNLESILNKELNKNPKIDFIRQSSIWRNMNRCEIVGCSKNNINKLFYFPLKNDMMEQEMMDRMINSKNILNLPVMKLDEKTKQGVGHFINKL